MQRPFHETHLSSSHGTNVVLSWYSPPYSSPRHSHTSSISSFFNWKTGQSQDKAEPPGATEHEDGDEERLARARETEREEAMVFLDVLVNYGCRRWLHKEDYSFE